jgi:outer membrane protein insertion porin family/translocation and assembly module TamA
VSPRSSRRIPPGARGRSLPSLLAASLLALAASLAPPARLGAQETTCDHGDVEVRSLDFTGNHGFSDAELGSAVVTTASSWGRRVFGFLGSKRCIDRSTDLPRDLLRLVIFYRNRGYAQATVDTVVREKPPGIGVTFRIHEGQPVIIDTLTIAGLDVVPERSAVLRGLPVRQGRPFDKPAIEATRDTLERRLRNVGYPTPLVLLSSSADTAAHSATVTYEVAPGPRARIGSVEVHSSPRRGTGEPAISEDAVRSVMGVTEGDLYRYSDLTNAQRNLYQTDAYQHVEVRQRIDSARLAADSTVDLLVDLSEGFMQELRPGIGYGTIDCFRAQADYVNRNFLPTRRGLRRLELSGRVSKIGAGDQFGALQNLCTQFATPNGKNGDVFADKVNYYMGATVRQPVLFGFRTVPSFTIYSERRSEYNAYRRTTPIGGIASITVRRRLPMTFAYELSLRKTEAQPALFCAVFNYCDADLQARLQKPQRLAVLSYAVTRDRANDDFNPTHGSVARLELRHASSIIGSDPDLQFNKGLADGSWYLSAGRGNVLALRLRAGAVFGNKLRLENANANFVPPEERLFAGGATTVRGFRQNELGPLLYVVSDTPSVVPGPNGELYYRASSKAIDRYVPSGGNSVIVANAEYRMRSPFLAGLLQWTVFTDAGALWNRDVKVLSLKASLFRVTPGVGVRVYTPVGPLRVDVGYNPYAQVQGPAYYSPPFKANQPTQPLFCVSPGNTLPVTLGADGEPVSQEGTFCPSDFEPVRRTGFFRRLTPTFSIQQAF